MKPIAINSSGMAGIDLEREDGRAVAMRIGTRSKRGIGYDGALQ